MLASIAIIAATSYISQYLAWIWCGLPSAVLWKDQLIVASNGRIGGAPGGMFRGTHAFSQKEVKSPILYDTRTYSTTTHLTKLDIRNGRVLVFTPGSSAGAIVPLDEIPGLERSEFGRAICRARGYENTSFLLAHFAAPLDMLLFPPHRKGDVIPPAIAMPRAGVPATPAEEFAERVGAYLQRARCDMQIAGAKSVRLFHATKNELFISVELDYLNAWYRDKDWNPIKQPPPAPDRQLRIGILPVDFVESFVAYTADRDDYLVTDNGKVYLAVVKGKTELEVTAVWNDPKQRIAGVVQDMDNSAVYGWGYSGDAGTKNRFYVKLAPKMVAVPYVLTVPMWNDYTDAYLESYECARACRKTSVKK